MTGILAIDRRNESEGARLQDLSIYDGRTEVFAFLFYFIFIIKFGKISSKKGTASGNLFLAYGCKGLAGQCGWCSVVVVCHWLRGSFLKAETGVALSLTCKRRMFLSVFWMRIRSMRMLE